jgi:hypothetical protein
MHIYHSRWHELSREHIENLFNKYLGDVTAFPFGVLPELSKLEKATLEVIEDRTKSTVYLIRETGKTYQLPKVQDEPRHSYKYKPCVFVISESENSHFIERQKSPKFRAEYNPGTKEIFNLEWIDDEPFQTTAIPTLKKAKVFLQERVK